MPKAILAIYIKLQRLCAMPFGNYVKACRPEGLAHLPTGRCKGLLILPTTKCGIGKSVKAESWGKNG